MPFRKHDIDDKRTNSAHIIDFPLTCPFRKSGSKSSQGNKERSKRGLGTKGKSNFGDLKGIHTLSPT